jgi:hypothetical protein
MMLTGVVWLVDFAHWRSLGGSKACYEADGTCGIDTSFSYPRFPIVELILPVVEVMLEMLGFYRVLEREVVRCLYRTGSCRAFCEEAVLQTA